MLKIDKSLRICIVGLGYVGLPLAVEFGRKYNTVGFDIDKNRISQLNNGIDITREISKRELLSSKNLSITNNKEKIRNCNFYIITVPTPVDKFNNPNLNPLTSATELVGQLITRNNIIVYESTVYPGVTENICVPILEKISGLIYNKEFFCGYSPERINPGDKDKRLTKIIKVTSGSNKAAANLVDKLYKSIITVGTHKASSISVAEAAKIIENVQRDVNIALINELSIIFHKLNIETNEVLSAAKTKWNFLDFKPGLVGGHCIGVDPYYLTHRAAEVGYHPEIILAGRKINDSMGKYIADSTIAMMTNSGIQPTEAKICILGITFKEDCPDIRNTKVPDIFNHLITFGCKVEVSDYTADSRDVKKSYDINLQTLKKSAKFDAIILAVSHKDYLKINKKSWLKILKPTAVFIDVKSAISSKVFENTNINYWAL